MSNLHALIHDSNISPELTNGPLLPYFLYYSPKRKKRNSRHIDLSSSNRGKHPSDERVKIESRIERNFDRVNTPITR